MRLDWGGGVHPVGTVQGERMLTGAIKDAQCLLYCIDTTRACDLWVSYLTVLSSDTGAVISRGFSIGTPQDGTVVPFWDSLEGFLAELGRKLPGNGFPSAILLLSPASDHALIQLAASCAFSFSLSLASPVSIFLVS